MPRKQRLPDEEQTLDQAESLAAVEAAREAESGESDSGAGEGLTVAASTDAEAPGTPRRSTARKPAGGATRRAAAVRASRDVTAAASADEAASAIAAAASVPAAAGPDIVHIGQGGADSIIADEVTITQGGAGQIRARSVNVSMGGAGLIQGDSVRIDQGGAFAIVARRVEIHNGGAFLLLARNVRGEVNVALDWRGIVAAVATFVLLRRLLRSRRKPGA